MMDTHTVIKLTPGDVTDTGIVGNRETCLACADILIGLEDDPQIFYAVVSIERDTAELRELIPQAA